MHCQPAWSVTPSAASLPSRSVRHRAAPSLRPVIPSESGRNKPEQRRDHDCRTEQCRPRFGWHIVRNPACKGNSSRQERIHSYARILKVLRPDHRFRFKRRLRRAIRREAVAAHGLAVHRDVDDRSPTRLHHHGCSASCHQKRAIDVRIDDHTPGLRRNLPKSIRLREECAADILPASAGVIHENVQTAKAFHRRFNNHVAVKLIDWAKDMFDYSVQIVKRNEQHLFRVLPKRWIVERTFAWLNWSRRLSKDYEIRHTSAESMIYIAFVHMLLRRSP